jgi:hypothetical protein
LIEKQLTLAFHPDPPHDEGMPSDRKSLQALKSLIADTDLILETTPDLPQNRTACCRSNLRVALALAEDLLKQQRMNPAAIMGHKGGSTTAKRLGADHYRKMSAARKTHAGGRPRKQAG